MRSFGIVHNFASHSWHTSFVPSVCNPVNSVVCIINKSRFYGIVFRFTNPSFSFLVSQFHLQYLLFNFNFRGGCCVRLLYVTSFVCTVCLDAKDATEIILKEIVTECMWTSTDLMAYLSLHIALDCWDTAAVLLLLWGSRGIIPLICYLRAVPVLRFTIIACER